MYFTIEKTIKIESIDELLELSKQKTFGLPGQSYDFNQNMSDIYYIPSYATIGIFRGQAKDWELIPSSYRNKDYNLVEDKSEIVKSFKFSLDNEDFFAFAKLASEQNNGFPKGEIDQMVLAQHYGIKTPLLDWTKSIFTAIYFALDLKNEDDSDKNLEPFIYHIRDERLLLVDLETFEKTENIKLSSFVAPLPIDRRVERQFSVFTFHPHPTEKPPKVSVDKYIISDKLFMKLWKLMKGMGFSSFHYFPDYAGLAERIKQGYMI